MRATPIVQTAVLAFLLAGAPSADAQTAQVHSAAPAAPTGRPPFADLSPDKRLAFEGGVLRLKGAASMEALFKALSPESAAALRTALGYRGDAVDGYWSVLLRSAVQYQRVTGETAQTLWWSPAADAGIALSWKAVGANWRVEKATPAMGETLRGQPIAFRGRPQWSAAGGDLAAALRQTAAATRQAVQAGALDRAFQRPPAALEVVGRTVAAESGLKIALGRASERRNTEARELLTRASVLTLSKQNARLASLLAVYSDEQRLMFEPRLAAANGGAVSVLWVSTGAPHRAVLMQYPSLTAPMPSAVAEISLAPNPAGAP